MYIEDLRVTRNLEVTSMEYRGSAKPQTTIESTLILTAGRSVPIVVLKECVGHHHDNTASIGDKISPVAVAVAERLEDFADRSEREENQSPFDHGRAGQGFSLDVRKHAKSCQDCECREMGDESALADLNGNAR